MAPFRPIFDFELKGKRSWAEPSWKSFSSSYGSSKLGSDSSLVVTCGTEYQNPEFTSSKTFKLKSVWTQTHYFWSILKAAQKCLSKKKKNLSILKQNYKINHSAPCLSKESKLTSSKMNFQRIWRIIESLTQNQTYRYRWAIEYCYHWQNRVLGRCLLGWKWPYHTPRIKM